MILSHLEKLSLLLWSFTCITASRNFSKAITLDDIDWDGIAFDDLSVAKLTGTGVQSIQDFIFQLRNTEALQEFGDKSEFLLRKANTKEWRRALDQLEESFPYIVCKQTSDSGYKTAEALRNALEKRGGTNETIAMEPILNTKDSYCCILRAPGVVALQAALDDNTFTFQPYLQSLKLVKNIWDTLQSFNNSNTASSITIDFDLCPSKNRDLNSTASSIADDSLAMLNNVTLLRESIIFWEDDDVDVPNKRFWENILYTLEEGGCTEATDDNLKWKYSPEELSVTIDTRTDSRCSTAIVAAVTISPKICSAVVRQPLKTRNKQAQWLVQSGIEEERPMHDFGIFGQDQVIAVSDTGLDTENCYFRDSSSSVEFNRINENHRKVREYKTYPGDKYDYKYGHGTHVVGSIVGSQEYAVDPNAGMVPGMAPKAKVAFMDMGKGQTLFGASPSEFTGMGRPKAKIHSASWGDYPHDTSYTLQAKAFDQYMYQHDDFLMILAAGNDGYGRGHGTVGAPATSKNCISVGASHSTGNALQFGPNYLADFSSRGPTADGRNKPDVVAPGKYILSAGAQPVNPGSCDPDSEPGVGRGKEGVMSMAGTSMSTPITAGHAALVRQYFEQGFYQKFFPEQYTMPPLDDPEISGALVKAVLMNGAQYLAGVGGGRGPQDVKPYDYNQNFGRLSMIDSLYLPGKSNRQIQVWDRQTILNDGLQQFEVSIDQSAGCTSKIFSVTLVWMDRAGYAFCEDTCLINNLDLSLQREGSVKRYFPNGRSSPDVKNNAERIQIFDARHSEKFILSIHAENLADRFQKYALVATGCFGGIAQTLDTSKDKYVNDDSEQRKTNLLIGFIVGGICLAVALFAGPTVWRRYKAKSTARQRGQKVVEEEQQEVTKRPPESDVETQKVLQLVDHKVVSRDIEPISPGRNESSSEQDHAQKSFDSDYLDISAVLSDPDHDAVFEDNDTDSHVTHISGTQEQDNHAVEEGGHLLGLKHSSDEEPAERQQQVRNLVDNQQQNTMPMGEKNQFNG